MMANLMVDGGSSIQQQLRTVGQRFIVLRHDGQNAPDLYDHFMTLERCRY
jgi:hypothetical protein